MLQLEQIRFSYGGIEKEKKWDSKKDDNNRVFALGF
jgi:hypothetical protein